MKIKTKDLTGAALDWAVAKCAGTNWRIRDGKVISLTPVPCPDDRVGCLVAHFACTVFAPSINWAEGGPIIERGGLLIRPHPGRTIWDSWRHGADNPCYTQGPTPLTAAMRCYVASKLGDEIEVPEELSSSS